MRGLISNAPVDYAMDGGILHSAISVGVICPDKHERRFAQFISELNYRSQAKHNTDYLITFPGFYQAFKTGLDFPEPNSGKWKQINASNEQDILLCNMVSDVGINEMKCRRSLKKHTCR